MKYIFSNSLSTKIEFQKVPRTSHLISGWFSPVSLLLTASSISLFCPSCDDLVRLQGLGLGWHWWCDCSGVNWDCGHWPDLGRRWSLATKVANADAGFCSWPCVWCARWVSGLGASLARLKRAAGCSRLGAAAPCSPVVMWGQAGSVLGRNWLTASGTDTVPLKWQSLVLCPFRRAQILKKKLSQRNTVELSPNVLGLSEQELVLPWNLIWSSAGAEDERQLMDYERSVISNVCYFIGGS